MARGAIWDEGAVADAIINGTIGGVASDVFSQEPLPNEHPYNKILDKENVILTPHMAWGSHEARSLCVAEMISNIRAFLKGEQRNRVDLI